MTGPLTGGEIIRTLALFAAAWTYPESRTGMLTMRERGEDIVLLATILERYIRNLNHLRGD